MVTDPTGRLEAWMQPYIPQTSFEFRVKLLLGYNTDLRFCAFICDEATNPTGRLEAWMQGYIFVCQAGYFVGKMAFYPFRELFREKATNPTGRLEAWMQPYIQSQKL